MTSDNERHLTAFGHLIIAPRPILQTDAARHANYTYHGTFAANMLQPHPAFSSWRRMRTRTEHARVKVPHVRVACLRDTSLCAVDSLDCARRRIALPSRTKGWKRRVAIESKLEHEKTLPDADCSSSLSCVLHVRHATVSRS